MGKVALLGVARLPIDLVDADFHRHLIPVVDVPAVRREGAELAVGKVNDPAGVSQQGAGVRSEERLAFADANDERAAEAGPDYQVGVAFAHDCQAVGALEERKYLADGGDEVTLEVVGDEVSDDLGVGLAVKLI